MRLIFLLFFSITAFASELKLDVKVDKALVTTGDIIMFTITMDAPKGLSVPIPNLGDKIQGFRIVDFGTTPEKSIDDRTISSMWYKLQADLTGSYILPATQITYKNSQGIEETIKSSEIFVEVESVLDKNKGEKKDIRDIKPIILSPPLWPYYLVGTLLLIGLIFAFIRFYKKRKNKKVEVIYIPPAHEVALTALKTIPRTPLKLFAFTLSEIFRNYFERRFKLPVTDKTLEEIKRDLDTVQQPSDELKKSFLNVLEKTELIKFSDMEISSKKDAWQQLLQEVKVEWWFSSSQIFNVVTNHYTYLFCFSFGPSSARKKIY